MKPIIISLLLFILTLSCKDERISFTRNRANDKLLIKCIESYIEYYDTISKCCPNLTLSIKEFSESDSTLIIIEGNSFLSSLIYDSVYYCTYIHNVLCCSNKRYPGFSDSLSFDLNVSKIYPEEYKYLIETGMTMMPEYIIEAKRLFVTIKNDSVKSCYLDF